MKTSVFQDLIRARRQGPRLLWLLDPDKVDSRRPDPRWVAAEELGVAAILVGSSQSGNAHFDVAVETIRRHTVLPLILFPGSASQVSPHVDAVLFLTLLSGRNPDYLVGEQVKGTPLVRDYGIEPIPTGYLLIDTGTSTSVALQSNTSPLPETEIVAVCDHALCAQYMGQQMIYLEAGSGARHPIGVELVAAVRRQVSVSLTIGGGIRTPEQCHAITQAGADFVVVGTALEIDPSSELLQELCSAAHATLSAVRRTA